LNLRLTALCTRDLTGRNAAATANVDAATSRSPPPSPVNPRSNCPTPTTRAVTIDAPPEEVWAWLVQIGHGRGGLYSYDALENLVGCDIHSARSILPEHQQLSVGDVVRMGPEGYPCFRVVHCASPNTLVLVGAHPTTAELPPLPAPTDRSETVATWQWALRGTPVGGTRLVARQRLTYPPGQYVLWHLVEPVAFVMERRMLLTLKHLAETADA
jgi:hypothetical protein